MIMDLGFCWASSRRHAEAPCEQHGLYHQHQNITVAQWGNSHHYVKSFNQLSSRISRLRWAYLAPITTSTRRRPMRAGWRRTSTWRWTQLMIKLLTNIIIIIEGWLLRYLHQPLVLWLQSRGQVWVAGAADEGAGAWPHHRGAAERDEPLLHQPVPGQLQPGRLVHHRQSPAQVLSAASEVSIDLCHHSCPH